jgi:hypothetical protein
MLHLLTAAFDPKATSLAIVWAPLMTTYLVGPHRVVQVEC